MSTARPSALWSILALLAAATFAAQEPGAQTAHPEGPDEPPLPVAQASAAEATPPPPPGSPDASDAEVLAVVNGEPILLGDVEAQLAQMHTDAAAVGGRSRPDLERLLFRLVNDVLLTQEAYALGLEEEADIAAKVEARREAIARERLEHEEITRGAAPTAEEIDRFYQDRYRRATLRVLTARERDEAAALRERLGGDEGFEALALVHSIDPFAKRGGLVEAMALIDIPQDIAEAAFAAPPGELVGPVRTALGWTLLRVEELQPADPARFEELAGEVGNLVRLAKSQELRTRLSETLRARHPVERDEAAIAAIVPERLPDGRLWPTETAAGMVVARVGGRAITAESYRQALMSRWKRVRNAEAAGAASAIVLARLIEEQLLTAEALARGYGSDLTAESRLHAYERKLLVPRFLQTAVLSRIEVTKDEMEAFYNEHAQSFPRPPRLRLAQISVPTEAEARRVAAQASSGGDFAWLARQVSVDGFAAAGGDRGWLTPSPGFDPFHDALMEAVPGDVLGPFEQGSWAVVKVQEREEQGSYSFREVSGNVRQALMSQKFERALDELVTKLRSRSEITVDEALLERLGVTGTAETQEDGAGTAHGHH